MYALDNKSGIQQMPEIPEVFSTTPLWFTEGRDGNAPSYPGAHWFNIVQAELLNILKEAGIEPDKHSLDQLAQALKILAGQVESITDLRQFEPLKDRQVAFVKGYYAGSDKGGGYFIADFADTVSADNDVTLFVTEGGKRWKRVYSALTVFDFGVRTDAVNSTAIDRLQAWHEPVLGLGKALPVNRKLVPAPHIAQVAYKYDGIEYLSRDYYESDCAAITRTGHYTAWTEHKAFVHNDTLFAPFMLAFRHNYDDLRIAWVRSFDGGLNWTTPDIVIDYHPQNPTLGWHCFSMGVVGNRLFAFVEERRVVDHQTNNCFIFSRPMTTTRTMIGGISQNGNIVTVTADNHGFFAGDKASFSHVGDRLLSGHHTIHSVIDANNFTVQVSTNKSAQYSGEWRMGVSFERNEWSKQEIGTLPDAAGIPFTHIHGFETVSATHFLAGFNNGSTVREIGYLRNEINWATGQVAVSKVLFEGVSHAGEPSIRWYNGKVYATTRNQATRKRPLFIRCDLDGSNQEQYALTNHNGMFSNIPFVIVDDVAYLFATERGENEWEAGDLTLRNARKGINRPRTFLLTIKLREFGQTNKVRTQVVYQGIHNGELGASGNGVGSAVYHDGQLIYLFGDEDARNAHSLVENASNGRNPYVDNGFPQEIFALRLKIKETTAGKPAAPLRGVDNVTLPVFKATDGMREVQSQVRFADSAFFAKLFGTAINLLLGAERAGQDFAALLTDIESNLNRLYLSSSNKASSANGALIVLHNERSNTPKIAEYYAAEHQIKGPALFNSSVTINTPPATANDNNAANTRWVNARWSGSKGEIGWSKRPDGLIEQWGRIYIGAYGTATVNLPIAFPNRFLNVVLTPDKPRNGHSVTDKTLSNFELKNTEGTECNYMWRALGD